VALAANVDDLLPEIVDLAKRFNRPSALRLAIKLKKVTVIRMTGGSPEAINAWRAIQTKWGAYLDKHEDVAREVCASFARRFPANGRKSRKIDHRNEIAVCGF